MWLKLRNIEFFISFCVYFLYLIYGVWRIYLAKHEIHNSTDRFFYEESALGKRDDSNDEFENYKYYLQTWWYWHILHLIVITTVRAKWPQHQSKAHAAVGAFILICSLRIHSIIIISAQMASYYLTAHLKSKSTTWLLTSFWMLVINYIKYNTYMIVELGYHQLFTLLLIVSWSILRCCSFCFNHLKIKTAEKSIEDEIRLDHFLGYYLYFPILTHGPFMDYRRYVTAFANEKRKFNDRIGRFLWDLGRALFWCMFLWFCFHFLYIFYMAKDIQTIYFVKPPIARYIVAYLVGLFFNIFYVSAYGFGSAFARMDGLDPPNLPRCIGRIHFYSDMWRYFDVGLYEFLFKYIFCALCERTSSIWRRLFASAITFCFIFAWHGMYQWVFIWSALNFAWVLIEKIFKTVEVSAPYRNWTEKHLGIAGQERLRALIASQLFIPASLSNLFICGSPAIAIFFLRETYFGGFWNYLIFTFSCYCFYQCSEAILIFQKFQKSNKNNDYENVSYKEK